MPNKNGEGPPRDSTGPRDGRGGGRGNHTNEEGSGSKTGGEEGEC